MSAYLKQQEDQLAPYFTTGLLNRKYTNFALHFVDDKPFSIIVEQESFRLVETDKPATLNIYMASHEECWQLLRGEKDGMEAFMAGAYRADGNIVLSQLLLYLFRSVPQLDAPTIPYRVKD
jgi:putative sterol carrier protein